MKAGIKKLSVNKKAVYNLIFLALVFIALTIIDVTAASYSMAVMVLKKATVYALLCVSMNLLNGFTGLFSLGQAGFMLIGAYVYGMFTIPVLNRAAVYYLYDGGLIQFAIPWGLGLLLSGVVAAVFAFLIGLPVLKLKSDYLAIATLGFAEILRALIQWKGLEKLTNGSIALRSFPYINSLMGYVGIVAVCILIIVFMINSTYGRAFKAIRDDEIAAQAMGINLAKHKMISFVTSSFFAGIGGALLAMYQTSVTAAPFSSALTYEILLIVVIGGIGSITGSVIASVLYIAGSEWWLRGLDGGTFLGIYAPTVFRSGFRMVVFSVVIMIIVLFSRKGIMGERELDVRRLGKFITKKVPIFFKDTLPTFVTKKLPCFFKVVLPKFFKVTLPGYVKRALGVFKKNKKGDGANE